MIHFILATLLGLMLMQTSQANAVESYNGLTKAERDKYYHLDQGSQFMPYDFFINLEQPDNRRPFINKKYLNSFGLFASPVGGQLNPGKKLPIGLAINNYQNEKRPEWNGRWVGVTCSACHQGQLQFNGQEFPIIGGSAQFNFHHFMSELDKSINKLLQDTPESNAALVRFVHRLNNSTKSAAEFRSLPTGPEHLSEVRELIKLKVKNISDHIQDNTVKGLVPGPRRIDAIAATHNRFFASPANIPQNAYPPVNPVKMPPMWWVNDYEYHHLPGFILPPLRRNISQSVATLASVDLTSTSIEAGLFESTSNLTHLIELERIISKLNAPDWNHLGLPEINLELAHKGKVLYQAQCLSCHGGYPTADNMSSPSQNYPFNNRKLIRNRRVPIQSTPEQKGVYTDPQYATQWLQPIKLPDSILPFMPPNLVYPGNHSTRAGTSAVVGSLVSFRAFGIHKAQPECKTGDECIGQWNKKYLEFDDYRDPDPSLNPLKGPNDFQYYRTSVLVGAWTTAPYLHNGSVPTLYDLLSPVDERPKVFDAGALSFDPVKVGLKQSSSKKISFAFDTELPGNRNIGHEFNGDGTAPEQLGPRLSPDDRMAIIEYLKTNLQVE